MRHPSQPSQTPPPPDRASAPRVVVVGGGVRSGKSSFAVEHALRLGERRAFIATATPSDDEMKARIHRHQRDRGGAFTTVEAPTALAEALASLASIDVVVVDCVTHWISNLLVAQPRAERSAAPILEAADAVVRELERRRYHTILVTNEVGMSVHPPTELGRLFVEACGWVHQRIARAADDVYLAVLGMVVPIRGGADAGERGERSPMNARKP